MSMKLVVDNQSGGPDDEERRRILAPGAPPSPGKLPNNLAAHLKHGEILAWWGAKEDIQRGLVLMTLAACLVALGLVSIVAPSFWSGPWSSRAGPLLALLAPAAFVFVREWLGRQAILVTGEAIIEVDRAGRAQRLPLTGIVAVRRDWLRGGIRLLGRRHQVRIGGELAAEARQAIASRLRGTVRAATEIDDPLKWLP
jgi:hypothetical protein